MARYVGVALLAALVLWTGEARGACAWVLWEEIEYVRFSESPSKSWTLHVARQTQGECEDVLTRTWQVKLKQWQPGPEKPGIKDTKSAPGYIAINFHDMGGAPGALASHTFRCFPDTLDPRGPKGAQ